MFSLLDKLEWAGCENRHVGLFRIPPLFLPTPFLICCAKLGGYEKAFYLINYMYRFAAP